MTAVAVMCMPTATTRGAPNPAVNRTALGAASPASAAGYLARWRAAHTAFAGRVRMILRTLQRIESPKVHTPMPEVQGAGGGGVSIATPPTVATKAR
jgi:hypothetical protein